MDPDYQEGHLKWPEKWSIDIATLEYIKIAFWNGITLGVLDFKKYVKRLDENC